MYQVYVLWHTHELKDDYGSHDEIKMIGIFSTKEKAQRAIEQLKDQEGFRDYPVSCLDVYKRQMWTHPAMRRSEAGPSTRRARKSNSTSDVYKRQIIHL